MKQLVFVAVVLGLLPYTTQAGDPAPAAASTTEAVAPHDCKKPVIRTKIRKADDDSDFQDKATNYGACINAYVAAQNDMAQKHTDAANAAVTEYNAFVKAVNAKRDE